MPPRPIQVRDGDGTGEIYRPDNNIDEPCFNRTGRGDMTVDGTRWWWRLLTELYRHPRLQFSYYDKAIKMRCHAGRFHSEWVHVLQGFCEEVATHEGQKYRFTMETKGDMANFIRCVARTRKV